MRIGIIGQGLAGTALAWQSHWAGHDVAIFDRGLKESASWVAAGLINPLVLRRKRLIKDASEHLAHMQSFYRRVEGEIGTTLFYPGPIHEILSDAQAEEDWKDLRLQREFESFLGEPQSLCHPRILGKSQASVVGSKRLRVPHYLMESRGFFKRHHSLEEVEVQSIERIEDGGLILNSTWKLDALLIAEGYPGKWTEKFFGALPFSPSRGEGLRVTWEGEEIPYALHENIFLLPDGDGSYQAGSTYSWDALSGPPSESAKEELLEKLRSWFDQPVEVLDQWHGIRPNMSDRQPRWAWHPSQERLGFLNGLGSRGALTSPWLSEKLLAGLKTSS